MSEPERPTCPFCHATAGELVSLFGSQLLFSQYRCRACGSYFEGLRSDRWADALVGRASARGGEAGGEEGEGDGRPAEF